VRGRVWGRSAARRRLTTPASLNRPNQRRRGRTGWGRILHTDALGSVTAITNDALDVELRNYGPFGEIEDSSLDKAEQGFTGHRHEVDLGLIDMIGRVYDPKIGRFLSPDPIIQDAFFSQSHNGYSYVLNDPTNLVDPSGYISLPIPNVGIGGGGGGGGIPGGCDPTKDQQCEGGGSLPANGNKNVNPNPIVNTVEDLANEPLDLGDIGRMSGTTVGPAPAGGGGGDGGGGASQGGSEGSFSPGRGSTVAAGGGAPWAPRPGGYGNALAQTAPMPVPVPGPVPLPMPMPTRDQSRASR
jgi:RHS repeat-associated protein